MQTLVAKLNVQVRLRLSRLEAQLGQALACWVAVFPSLHEHAPLSGVLRVCRQRVSATSRWRDVRTPGGGGLGGVDASLRWIAWDALGTLVGPFTTVDDGGYVRYARATAKRQFSAEVVAGKVSISIPSATVQMVRARGEFRVAMPPAILCLQKCIETQLGPAEPQKHLRPHPWTCHVCSALVSASVELCCVCGLARHREREQVAAQELLHMLGAAARTCGVVPHGVAAPVGPLVECGCALAAELQQFVPFQSATPLCSWCGSLLETETPEPARGTTEGQ